MNNNKKIKCFYEEFREGVSAVAHGLMIWCCLCGGRVPSLAWGSGLKDLAFPQLWLRLQLQVRFSPWPGNILMPWVWPQKRKEIPCYGISPTLVVRVSHSELSFPRKLRVCSCLSAFELASFSAMFFYFHAFVQCYPLH